MTQESDRIDRIKGFYYTLRNIRDYPFTDDIMRVSRKLIDGEHIEEEAWQSIIPLAWTGCIHLLPYMIKRSERISDSCIRGANESISDDCIRRATVVCNVFRAVANGVSPQFMADIIAGSGGQLRDELYQELLAITSSTAGNETTDIGRLLRGTQFGFATLYRADPSIKRILGRANVNVETIDTIATALANFER